jgi:hypothetical protein
MSEVEDRVGLRRLDEGIVSSGVTEVQIADDGDGGTVMYVLAPDGGLHDPAARERLAAVGSDFARRHLTGLPGTGGTGRLC